MGAGHREHLYAMNQRALVVSLLLCACAVVACATETTSLGGPRGSQKSASTGDDAPSTASFSGADAGDSGVDDVWMPRPTHRPMQGASLVTSCGRRSPAPSPARICCRTRSGRTPISTPPPGIRGTSASTFQSALRRPTPTCNSAPRSSLPATSSPRQRVAPDLAGLTFQPKTAAGRSPMHSAPRPTTT